MVPCAPAGDPEETRGEIEIYPVPLCHKRDAIGAADLALGNDTTDGGDDVDICFLDTKFFRFPRVCEVVRSISD